MDLGPIISKIPQRLNHNRFSKSFTKQSSQVSLNTIDKFVWKKILFHYPSKAEGLYHPLVVKEDVEGDVQGHLHDHAGEGGVFGTHLQLLQLVVGVVQLENEPAGLHQLEQ